MTHEIDYVITELTVEILTNNNIGRASFIFIDLAPHFPKANNMLDKIDEKDSLTGVLDKLTKSLPSAKIPFLDIKVNYDPRELSKIPEFKKTLDDLVKSPAIKGRDGKVSPTKLQRQLQNSKIQITSKTSSELIKDVAGLVGDNEVLGQVEAFSITLTKNMLKRYAGQFDFELKKSWMDMLR